MCLLNYLLTYLLTYYLATNNTKVQPTGAKMVTESTVMEKPEAEAMMIFAVRDQCP